MTDPRRSAVVAFAAAEIGAGDVRAYWQSCGVAPPYPPAWCGAFALAMLHEASVASRVMWRIGLGFCEVQGLAKVKDPLPGDVAYTDKPFQHHALVESWDGTTLVTIDGNQPDVRRRSRPMPKGIVFYSIAKFLGQTTPSPAPSPAPKPVPSAPTLPPTPAPDSGHLRGIDVSHHQAPGAISWPRLAETHRFVYARATYGTKPDATFAEHIRRAREVGLFVGAYAFFRPGQDVAEQLAAFENVVDAAGMGPGWLAPALDVEQNEQYDGPISAARYAPAETICRAWRERYGDAVLYTNPAMWPAIGNPDWLREFNLWIAHYDVATPRTPFGLSWAIWQHRVAPLPGVLGSPLDQNVARALPILRAPTESTLLPLVQDLDERRADRDASIRDKDDP